MILCGYVLAGSREVRSVPNGERGYAMLMVMFMATVMLVMASAVAVNHITEARRQQEAELAWRGNQYVRAIKLYYQKNGHFPKNLEDLTKYVIDQPRYLRKAYKDPMNTADGSWRFIYLGPGGTLINGVMHKTWYAGGLLAGPPQVQPPAAGTQGNPSTAGNGATGGATASGGSPQPPVAPADPNQTGQGTSGAGSSAAGNSPIGSGPVFGGQLVGIASTVKLPSIRVLDGGVTYYEWEFICDPTKPGNVCNTTGIGNMPGVPPTTPSGTSPGTPPPQNPPAGPGTPGGPGGNPQQNPQQIPQ